VGKKEKKKHWRMEDNEWGGAVYRLFVRSCVRSFVRSFVGLCVCSFVRSFIRLFIRSLVWSVRSFVRSFGRSLVVVFSCFLAPCSLLVWVFVARSFVSSLRSSR